VRLNVGFKPLPGRGVHLIVFALVAFSRHLGLAMRQVEKCERYDCTSSAKFVSKKGISFVRADST
jgi:hypothetical protein